MYGESLDRATASLRGKSQGGDRFLLRPKKEMDSLPRDRRTPVEDHGEPLLSAEQVAALCGLSRRAVYDAIKRGELPALKLCSRLRVRTADFDGWLARSAVASPPSRSAPAKTAGPPASPLRGSLLAKLKERA